MNHHLKIILASLWILGSVLADPSAGGDGDLESLRANHRARAYQKVLVKQERALKAWRTRSAWEQPLHDYIRATQLYQELIRYTNATMGDEVLLTRVVMPRGKLTNDEDAKRARLESVARQLAALDDRRLGVDLDANVLDGKTYQRLRMPARKMPNNSENKEN